MIGQSENQKKPPVECEKDEIQVGEKCVKESECKCYISDKCITSGYEFVSRNCDRKCICNSEGQFMVQVQSGQSWNWTVKRIDVDGHQIKKWTTQSVETELLLTIILDRLRLIQ